ncbi:MAG: trypsin-like serine protease [Thermoleophilia bacterium]|nr:trypsin-like serine protease [Thermoleophilia bacterium]
MRAAGLACRLARYNDQGGPVRKLVLLLAVLATAATASSASAITYGTPTGGAYPYVGGLVTTSQRTGERYVYCTGTLVSPTVVLTAAHCDISDTTGTNQACVMFDPQLTSKSKLFCGRFVASPYYTHKQNDPNDLAVIVFDRPIRGIQPATLVSEVGYLDRLFASGQLNQATQFLNVGYGGTEFTNEAGGPRPTYLDTRMYSYSSFNALGPGYLRLSQNQATGDAGTCYGDSGGPQFLDGVLVSITVTGDVFCKATNVVQRLDTELAQSFLSRFV